MKIDLKNIDESITIIECVLREQFKKDDEEGYSTHSFQANVKVLGLIDEDYLYASFSYYNKHGEFLGLNDDSLHAGDFLIHQPSPISFDLNIPSDTDVVRCQLDIEKHQFSIWDHSWKAIGLLVCCLLLSHLIKIWL